MQETILKIKDFLQKSSQFYCDLVQRKRRDLEIYSGQFWVDSVIDALDRRDRICRSFTQYQKFCNAICSPFSKSPYHCELDDENGQYAQLQATIDEIENRNNFKFVVNQALRHACIQGVGYLVLSFDNNEIVPEVVRDISLVALDPNVQSLNADDADKGAVVNFISKAKAKRLYGEDVYINEDTYTLDDIGSQWQVPDDSMPIVSYWEMNDHGTVDFYKVCGDLVIKDKVELPISRIPIFRMCFNEVVRNNKIDYNGIVDMTADLQYGLNIAYSTLLERANRSPKANYLMTPKMIDGLADYYKKLQTKESLVALYNPDNGEKPTPIIETYQTQDLMNTIDSANNLMAQVIGVPVGGINPAMNSQTATEILVQQNNSESNVNSLYDNAADALYSLTKTIIECLCYVDNIEQMPTFKLINGPQIITRMMKRRQELLALSSIVDDKTRTILAKHVAETFDADLKEPLVADIVANSQDVMFLSDSNQGEDPQAVSVLNKMNAVLEETQAELEQQIAANVELKKELDAANLQLLNAKEQHIIEVQKHFDDMELQNRKLDIEEAKVQIDASKANAELENDVIETESKQNIEYVKLQKELADLEKKKLEIMSKMTVGV
jgi:hypothetical protein